MKKKKSLAFAGTLLAAVTAGSMMGAQIPALTVMADDSISSSGKSIIMASSDDTESEAKEEESSLIYDSEADSEETEDADTTANDKEGKTKDESDTETASTIAQTETSRKDAEEKTEKETEETKSETDAVSIENKFQDEGQATVEIDKDVAKVVVLPEVKREGYKFLYWNTKEDGSGTTYHVGDKFTIGSENDLYAIWEKADSTTFHVKPDEENVISENKTTD